MDDNMERVRKNVRSATTETLLDRVTAYRGGMAPSAIEMMEEELGRRGIGRDAIERHETTHSAVLRRDGVALKCSFCENPARVRGWNWHRFWGRIPIFPRRFRYCEIHAGDRR